MVKKISIGIIIAVVSLWLAHSMVGFPFEKPIIFYSLRATDGFLVSASEDVEDGERGTVYFYQYTFTYNVEGKELTRNIQREGRLKPEFKNISEPIPVTVMYSSILPFFAQLDDDGEVTFSDYVVRGTLATLFGYGIALWFITVYFRSLKD